jgi:hypothetical protein
LAGEQETFTVGGHVVVSAAAPDTGKAQA